MTAEQLTFIEREAGRYTGPSGGPVVILDADEFDAMLTHAKALQAFATEVLERGFIQGLTDAELVSTARSHGIIATLPASDHAAGEGK